MDIRKKLSDLRFTTIGRHVRVLLNGAKHRRLGTRQGRLLDYEELVERHRIMANNCMITDSSGHCL